MTNFYSWLQEQDHRGDSVGHFVRAVNEWRKIDIYFRIPAESAGVDGWFQALFSNNPDSEMAEALSKAYREWEATSDAYVGPSKRIPRRF